MQKISVIIVCLNILKDDEIKGISEFIGACKSGVTRSANRGIGFYESIIVISSDGTWKVEFRASDSKDDACMIDAMCDWAFLVINKIRERSGFCFEATVLQDGTILASYVQQEGDAVWVPAL
jgi:hypothetical protein